MTISSIRRNVKNGGRCSIFVDGEFLAACSIDIAMTLGLHKGMAMTDELQRRLRQEDRRLTLRQKAYQYAVYKPRTERQMLEKLQKLDAVPEEIDDVMTWLQSFRLIDDAMYAERFVAASRDRKPMSRAALRRALKLKGISDVIVDVILRDLDADADVDAARRVAEKKLRMLSGTPPPLRREKLMRFLQYRGYSWDVVRRVLAEVA